MSTSLNTSANGQRQEDAPSESTSAGTERQTGTVTGGSSITEIKDQVVSATGQTLDDAKQTVLNDMVPAATGALQNAQENLRSIAGGDKAGIEGQSKQGGYSNLPLSPCGDWGWWLIDRLAVTDTTDRTRDADVIDRMDKEDVSDFLREKHMSTKPPPSTK